MPTTKSLENEFFQMMLNMVQSINCKLDKFIAGSGQGGQFVFSFQRGVTLTTHQRNIGDGASIILGNNENRLSFSIINNGLTTLYIGSAADTAISNGFPIASGRTYSSETYKGAIYGVTTGVITDVRAIEESI